jgi:glucarate dehydratase
MNFNRREWLLSGSAAAAASQLATNHTYAAAPPNPSPLRITGLTVTPVALPDPPLLAASGCHGPYFLRNVVELATDSGIVGVGETHGGEGITAALEKARDVVIGKNAFAIRSFARELSALDEACYAGIELACLDACGRAAGRRLCELLGGPVRDEVEFAAYLFYRYASDHPKLLADRRLVDERRRSGHALDDWGEVRTPQAMANMAVRFRERFGFRVFKLKAGVFSPDAELETMRLLHGRLGSEARLRIDPNARWKLETAIRIGKALTDLRLEYYEDPVVGQRDMAEVHQATGLPMSTNMCVTRFGHIPDALRLRPCDVVLADHHYWGGMAGCLALGPIAETAAWRLGQHSNNHAGITMAAMIHLAAALPQLTLASDTHYPWLVEGADLIAGPNLAIRGGRMSLPAGAGLGVELDRDKLARAAETYRRCGMRNRDDAGTIRLIVPAWKPDLL